jgi:integration host factor subunit beta
MTRADLTESFIKPWRRGRIGRNPKTEARVDVPATDIAFFKPSKELHGLVDKI